jgi:hypothetical protein
MLTNSHLKPVAMQKVTKKNQKQLEKEILEHSKVCFELIFLFCRDVKIAESLAKRVVLECLKNQKKELALNSHAANLTLFLQEALRLIQTQLKKSANFTPSYKKFDSNNQKHLAEFVFGQTYNLDSQDQLLVLLLFNLQVESSIAAQILKINKQKLVAKKEKILDQLENLCLENYPC